MYERRHSKLLPRKKFYHRVARHFAMGLGAVVISLLIGVLGYHHFEKMSCIDAFVNASMILSGMGPVGTLQTDGGKIFAGCYALYSGLALITIMGIILAPVIHRAFHKFHLEDARLDSGKE